MQEALNLVRTKCRPAHLPFSGILLQCGLVQIRSKLLSDLCAFSFWGFCRSSFVDRLSTAGLQTTSLKKGGSCFCTAGIYKAVACGSALASSPRLRRRFSTRCERAGRAGKSAQASFTALLYGVGTLFTLRVLSKDSWDLKVFTQSPRGLLPPARVVGETRPPIFKRRASSFSKREVWRSFLVGRAVLSENSIVWSLQQRRIKVCERGIQSSGYECHL